MFQNDALYRPGDQALRSIAAVQTLAEWRHKGRGPKYLRIEGRIHYLGKHLNQWLEGQVIEPAGERTPADAA